jgi:hypothetical protein
MRARAGEEREMRTERRRRAFIFGRRDRSYGA